MAYTTCPKCRHVRAPGDRSDPDRCPACGLVFTKWMKQRFAGETTTQSMSAGENSADSILARLSASLFYVNERTEALYFYGRVLLFIGLLVLGWRFIMMDFETNAIGNSFLHNINLVFHEAGHIIFSPFGYFMTKLGGTLAQCLMPLIVMLVFLVQQHNPFAASVGLWWLAQNLMDCAPYVNDALHQDLVLLGGVTGHDRPGYHDWNSILGELNMLEKHREVAVLFDTSGTILMILAFAWGAWLLKLQFDHIA